MLTYMSGNIIDLAFNDTIDVLVHGCNCQQKMKSGLAKEVAERIPQAVEVDLSWKVPPHQKLGHYTFALVPRAPFSDDVFVVVNAYTQLRYASKEEREEGKRMVDYEALYQVLSKIRTNMEGLRVGFPRIGCGLAGGSWKIVEAMLDELWEEEELIIVDKL